MKRWFKSVAHAFVVRVDWFAVIYVGGAMACAWRSNLLATVTWAIGVPIGYGACALHESKRQKTEEEETP